MPKPITLDSQLAADLQRVLGDTIIELTAHYGDLTAIIDKSTIRAVCQELRDNPSFQFNQMLDITAADYLDQELDYRFQVVYHFLSLETQNRLRIKCNITEDDPSIDSIHDLWKAVNWYERECYDMYGITFEGHPNLTRILMYEGFEGHPLRKDYEITYEQPREALRAVPERHDYSGG